MPRGITGRGGPPVPSTTNPVVGSSQSATTSSGDVDTSGWVPIRKGTTLGTKRSAENEVVLGPASKKSGAQLDVLAARQLE